MTTVVQDTTLARATHKLHHSADNGEYSAIISPLECAALLDELETLSLLADAKQVLLFPESALPSERRQA